MTDITNRPDRSKHRNQLDDALSAIYEYDPMLLKRAVADYSANNLVRTARALCLQDRSRYSLVDKFGQQVDAEDDAKDVCEVDRVIELSCEYAQQNHGKDLPLVGYLDVYDDLPRGVVDGGEYKAYSLDKVLDYNARVYAWAHDLELPDCLTKSTDFVGYHSTVSFDDRATVVSSYDNIVKNGLNVSAQESAAIDQQRLWLAKQGLPPDFNDSISGGQKARAVGSYIELFESIMTQIEAVRLSLDHVEMPNFERLGDYQACWQVSSEFYSGLGPKLLAFLARSCIYNDIKDAYSRAHNQFLVSVACKELRRVCSDMAGGVDLWALYLMLHKLRADKLKALTTNKLQRKFA